MLRCDPPSLNTIGSSSFSLSEIGKNIRSDMIVSGIFEHIK